MSTKIQVTAEIEYDGDYCHVDCDFYKFMVGGDRGMNHTCNIFLINLTNDTEGDGKTFRCLECREKTKVAKYER